MISIEHVTHLMKDEVAAIIAKHFNTTTSNVFIDYDIEFLKYGTDITDNYSQKPLAIVRRYDELLECRRDVERYSKYEQGLAEQLKNAINSK